MALGLSNCPSALPSVPKCILYLRSGPYTYTPSFKGAVERR